MNPSIVIVRIVRGNQLLIQVKDLSRPAPTAVELCIGMFVGNAQTVEKKLTLTKTIMIVLSKVMVELPILFQNEFFIVRFNVIWVCAINSIKLDKEVYL